MKVKTKQRKNGKVKEPSLLRKIITVYYENAKQRKATRLLAKQTWSLDFLIQVLIKASKASDKCLTISITDIDGKTITLCSEKLDKPSNENIFDKLDDDLAIDSYIRTHSTRG